LVAPVSQSHDPFASSSSFEPACSEAHGESVKAPATASREDILTTTERLLDLRQRKVLTEEEFAAKKAELLNRHEAIAIIRWDDVRRDP
jgi:hypothetical protein